MLCLNRVVCFYLPHSCRCCSQKSVIKCGISCTCTPSATTSTCAWCTSTFSAVTWPCDRATSSPASWRTSFPIIPTSPSMAVTTSFKVGTRLGLTYGIRCNPAKSWFRVRDLSRSRIVSTNLQKTQLFSSFFFFLFSVIYNYSEKYNSLIFLTNINRS